MLHDTFCHPRARQNEGGSDGSAKALWRTLLFETSLTYVLIKLMTKENALMAEREEKLKNLREKGVDPYGARYERSHTIKEAIDNFKEGKCLSLAGRIMG